MSDSTSPLDALGSLTERELARRRDDAWVRIRACRADVSPSNVLALLALAVEHRAVNSSGILLRPGDLDFRVRIEAVQMGMDRSLVVSLVSSGGEELVGTEWMGGRMAAQVVADLDEELEYATDRPQLRIDASALFSRLIETVQVGFEARFGEVPPDLLRPAARPAPGDLWPLIEIVNRQWVVTVGGVQSVDEPWRIAGDDLEDVDVVGEAAALPWVRVEDLEEACEEAIRVLPWFGLRSAAG